MSFFAFVSTSTTTLSVSEFCVVSVMVRPKTTPVPVVDGADCDNRLRMLPGGSLLHGLRSGRDLCRGIAAAFAALVPGRRDHAKEAVDGHARRVGTRVKEELVGPAAVAACRRRIPGPTGP